ncbi:MFS transporter, partial [Cutibacterium acnes subsp. acnes]|nr:MFS transporter [Cutibacterium acnes subsp. acnes]
GVLVTIGVVVAALQVLTGDLVTTVATTGLLVPVGTAVAYFVVMFRSPKVSDRERGHLWAFVPLWVGQVLFTMIFEQAAGKMATFAKDNTDGHIVGSWSVEPEQYH